MKLKTLLLSLIFFLAFGTSLLTAATPKHIIMIITDDQGYGDIGAHGNTMIQTPHLDQLWKESVRLTNYHVDPTCSPTRSALMSGRYSTRTGVWHTIMGRSMMRTEEVTIPEALKKGQYKTGMFGKWHLGDNAPLRPQDQGFDTAFYHGGGGVGQTPDYFDNDYFDDIYFRDGVPEKTFGYCTDVWFSNAMNFIRNANKKGDKTFTYLSTNAPHGPFLVAEKYSKPYEEKGVEPTQAKFLGMITNIDENLGKLRKMLKKEGLENETLLIFTTDNGTARGAPRKAPRRKAKNAKAWTGFNSGMRGTKGSEYDGGHRVPCFFYWPAGGMNKGRDVNQLTAHIDMLPTLSELCGVETPKVNPIDGKSIASLLSSPEAGKAWPERTLLVHSQRVEHPQKWRKSAVMTQQYRLINGKELYDIQKDPGQTKNIASDHPQVVEKLKASYEAWWKSLEPSFKHEVRIAIGSKAENPVQLTCHDWHTNNKGVPWHQNHIRSGPALNGYWSVDVKSKGKYKITLRRWPRHIDKDIEAVNAMLQVDNEVLSIETEPDARSVSFTMELKAGPQHLQTWLEGKNGKMRGAYFVEILKL